MQRPLHVCYPTGFVISVIQSSRCPVRSRRGIRRGHCVLCVRRGRRGGLKSSLPPARPPRLYAPLSALSSGNHAGHDLAGADGGKQPPRRRGGPPDDSGDDDDPYHPPGHCASRILTAALFLLTTTSHVAQARARSPTADPPSPSPAPDGADDRADAAGSAPHTSLDECRQPGDQPQGPIRQVVFRAPMKRLVLPRDLIHEVINELAAYNAADGEPIDYESIRQALTRLNAFYAEHGYRFHRVRRCDDQPIRDGVLELEAFEPQVARVVLRVVDDHDNECHRRTQTALVARALGYPGLEWEPTGDAKQLARQARRRRRAIKRPFRWTDWHFWRMHQIGLFKRMSVDAHLIPPPSTTDGATADVAPDAGDVEVVLTVQERSFRRFEPGITYSVGKLFGDVSYEDGNVGGNACRLRLDYKRQPGQEDNMLALEWDDPRIASAQGSYGLRLYESRDMQYGDRRGVSVTFASPPPRWARLPPPVPSTTTRQDHWLRRLLDVSERWAVHTGVSFEQVQESKAQARCAAPRYAEVVASMMATTDANGEATNHTNGVAASRTAAPPRLTFRQLLLTANIARDTRDDVLVPQGGHRASLTTSYAVPLRGMCAEYSRFTGTVSRYWAIPLRRRRRQQQQQPTKPPSLPRSNSGASADADAPARKNPCVAALADVRLASASLPPIEHHLLGGSGTVRGMDVGRLGRHASFARFSGELRLPIDDKSAVVAFADWATEVRLHRDASDAWARLRGGHRLGSGTTDSDTIPRASAASVGLGARVGGAMQIDCAWVVRPEGARPGKWLALDRAYWHVGMMDMNF